MNYASVWEWEREWLTMKSGNHDTLLNIPWNPKVKTKHTPENYLHCYCTAFQWIWLEGAINVFISWKKNYKKPSQISTRYKSKTKRQNNRVYLPITNTPASSWKFLIHPLLHFFNPNFIVVGTRKPLRTNTLFFLKLCKNTQNII